MANPLSQSKQIEDNAVRWKIRQGVLPEYQCVSTLVLQTDSLLKGQLRDIFI